MSSASMRGARRPCACSPTKHGQILARARGEGANLQAVGELQVEKILHTVMAQAIGDRRIVPAAICLGIAGVDRPNDAAVVREHHAADRPELAHRHRQRRADRPRDRRAGAAGSGDHLGHRLDRVRAECRRRGGAIRRLGLRARRRGQRLLDRTGGAARGAPRRGSRGPGTVLTQMLLDHFQVSQPQLLLHEVYHHHLKPAAIGALASCVQTAFSEGDEAAAGILRGAADELEGSALSVARRLDLTGEAFTLHPVGRHLSGGAVAGAGAVAAAAAGGAAQLDETARSRTRRGRRDARAAGSARRGAHPGLQALNGHLSAVHE